MVIWIELLSYVNFSSHLCQVWLGGAFLCLQCQSFGLLGCGTIFVLSLAQVLLFRSINFMQSWEFNVRLYNSRFIVAYPLSSFLE
jgi:hypothetical protein